MILKIQILFLDFLGYVNKTVRIKLKTRLRFSFKMFFGNSFNISLSVFPLRIQIIFLTRFQYSDEIIRIKLKRFNYVFNYSFRFISFKFIFFSFFLNILDTAHERTLRSSQLLKDPRAKIPVIYLWYAQHSICPRFIDLLDYKNNLRTRTFLVPRKVSA